MHGTLDDLPKDAKNRKKKCLALNVGVTPQTWFPMNAKHRVHCVRIIRDSPWALGRPLPLSPLFPIAKKSSEILKEKEGKEKGEEEEKRGIFYLTAFYLTASVSQTLFFSPNTNLTGMTFSQVSGSQRFQTRNRRCYRDLGWSLVDRRRGKNNYEASQNFLNGRFTLPVDIH